MSVRRTVAQSSAGLLLLAAFVAGPSVAFGDAAGEVPQVPNQAECDGAPATASADTSAYETDGTVTITGTCFPTRIAVDVDIIKEGAVVETLQGQTDGSGTVVVSFEPKSEGTYTATIKDGASTEANVPFTVSGPGKPTDPPTEEPTDPPTEEPTDPPTGEPTDPPTEEPTDPPTEEPTDPPETEEPTDPAPGDGDDDESPNPGDGDEQNDDGSGSGDDTQDQDGNGQDPDDDEVVDGDPGTGDGQTQDDENNGTSDDTEGSEEEQQGGDTTASGSPTRPFPGDEQGGDTSASAANDNAASRGDAPAQPPAAPGSATNDFPAAQQEATADQKQSAALAVLMTQLFAGGVSSGSVGTTPDQARTVIDPSADASEIEVPVGSDNGGSSDDGSGSETSDGDALAATGSNMLVPAGIAAAAILLGAGLKIHQIRRGL